MAQRSHSEYTALLATAERAPWRSANGRTEQQLYRGLGAKLL